MEKINPHLKILVQLAKVDGSADGSELALIRQIGSSHKISDTDIEEAIAKAEKTSPVDAVDQFSRDEKIELVYNLALVTMADGIIHTEEVKFCIDIIKKMGFKESVLFELVEAVEYEGTSVANKEKMLKLAETYINK